MYLSQALQRNNNNLDVIRLLAACAVIYGHANAMVPEAMRQPDVVAQWLSFDYSASLAVKLFFFLSGLVVTNSLLDKQSLWQFSLARVFRIWPALIAVLLVMSYVVGPAVTQLPIAAYLQDPATARYVLNGMAMRIDFELPGVFVEHMTRAVNGSLWSIPYEVKTYAMLAALFALGVHRQRWLAVACCVWVCVDPLLTTRTLFVWQAPNSEIDPLLPCFAGGALLALFKDKVRISWAPVLGFFTLFWLFEQAVFAHYLFYGFLFFGVLYICTQPWMTSWRLPADISYGVYLWGWPVQQLLAHVWPEMGIQGHRALAMLGACVCGALSWYWLEKPGIAAGRRCHAWCMHKLNYTDAQGGNAA